MAIPSTKRVGMDMTHGSLWNKILIYALPLAATGMCQQLFNAADIAVIGQFVGKEAMAAVGSNGPLIGIIVSFFMGISLGASVIIAQAIGRKDDSAISRALHTSILMAVLGGTFMAIIGNLAARHVLLLTGVPSEVLDMAELYFRIYLSGMPVVLLYNFLAAIFRGQGDSRTPLYALVLSGIINVILNVFFVVKLGWTVDGVATATVIANGISSACLLWKLHSIQGPSQFHIKLLKLDKESIRQILKIGLPSGLQGTLFSFSNIIVQSAINSLGATVMAASSAAFNIEILTWYMMNSYNQAAATFVGQNFGAGQADRCRKVYKLCIMESYISTLIIVILISLNYKALFALFNPDPAIMEIGLIRVIYLFIANIFSVWLETSTGYLRGFGISVLPMVIAIVCICCVRLIWVATIFQISHTFSTLMLLYPVSIGLGGIAMATAVFKINPVRKYME